MSLPLCLYVNVKGDKGKATFLSGRRIISTPLRASNTNVCLNWLQPREIKEARLMNGHFAVLTGIGVPVKIRAVLRSP